MTTNDDAAIADLLRGARTIAIVGASPDPSRPSYGVAAYLAKAGYTILPINPGAVGKSLAGQPFIAGLADLTAPVDIVDVFRRSDAVRAVIDEAIALREQLGIKAVWLQLGVVDEAAAAAAEAAGLTVVMDRCIKVEHRRLLG